MPLKFWAVPFHACTGIEKGVSTQGAFDEGGFINTAGKTNIYNKQEQNT